MNKLASCRILENLGFEFVLDIRNLFEENNNQNCFSDTMGEYFTQLNFSQIAGQPHRLLDKAVEKLPMFTGIDATTPPCISEVFLGVLMPLSMILHINMMMST